VTSRAGECGVLVVAKAPVAGLAKTRIGASVGPEAAAELAAAALLDTLDAVESWAAASYRVIAMTGSLAGAARGPEIERRLAAWTVVEQTGATFADRLVSAHRVARSFWSSHLPVVQIGMDTPSITSSDLDALLRPIADSASGGADVALGPAVDGGWWGIATRAGATYADQLADVPMSRSDTAERTVAVLEAAGATVQVVHELRDVDEWTDAVAVSTAAPHLRLSRAMNQLAPALAT